MRYLFRLLGLFIALRGAVLAQENLFDARNSLRFANHLYRNGNYAFAAREYERVAFLMPDNDSVKIALMAAYRKAGQYQQAADWVQQQYRAAPLPQPIAWEYGKNLVLMSSGLQASKWLAQQRSLARQDSLHLALALALQHRQWKKADSLCQGVGDSKTLQLYRPIIQEALAIRTKNPMAATALGIVPGMGKVYTHQWKDGLMAIILIGGLSWQSYRGFKANGVQSVRGWGFGALGAGFYASSIYGSYTAAIRWNEAQQRTVSQKAKAAVQRIF